MPNEWRLTGPRTIVKKEQDEAAPGNGQVKVKVTRALLSDYDVGLYGGVTDAVYPMTLGRNAVGVITEFGATGCEDFRKYTASMYTGSASSSGAPQRVQGMKEEEALIEELLHPHVYLEPVRPCGTCAACRSERYDECRSLMVAGRDFDGYFRDFVTCSINDVMPLPMSVDDDSAVHLETVALADKVIDRLALVPAKKVAVIGGGFMGYVTAQVATYHKLTPIIIVSDSEEKKLFEDSGFFYVYEADTSMRTLSGEIKQCTSGLMCDGAVYIADRRLNPACISAVTSKGSTVVFSGFTFSNFAIDIREMIDGNFTYCSVTDGYGHTGTAMNMLLNGAVKFGVFPTETVKDGNVQSLLDRRLSEEGQDDSIIVLKSSV